MRLFDFHFKCFLRLSLLCCGTFVCTAAAGESENYSIAPQSQSTGTRSTSANYTLDTSASSGAATSSAALTLRGGFAGALYDATALDVTASPLTVNEGGTRQLAASLILDDATQQLLSPGTVAWSVLSGPLTVNAGGLATAGSVTANTGATVRGAYQTLTDTLTLQVLNTDGYDYSSDTIPDDWQTQYFGPANPAAAPGEDPDGDGWNNLFEYTAGLGPTDAASRFSVTIAAVPGQPAQKRIIFGPIVAGRTYTVQTPASLSAGPWQSLSGATLSDAGGTRTVTDPNGGGAGKFYRVQVAKP